MDTVKLKLTIAYDGTAYAGWQTQSTGVTVQQKVEEVLARYFPSRPKVHSSSRTDTGVHAIGMVAHFEVPRAELKIPPSKLLLSLNAFLPEDIRVMEVTRCRADFHARYNASGKAILLLCMESPRDESAIEEPRVAGAIAAGHCGHARGSACFCGQT